MSYKCHKIKPGDLLEQHASTTLLLKHCVEFVLSIETETNPTAVIEFHNNRVSIMLRPGRYLQRFWIKHE